MKVQVEYFGMLREAAGRRQEDVDVPDGMEVQALLQHVARQHGDPLQAMVLGEGDAPHPWLLIAVDDVVASPDAQLAPDSHVLLSSPISGG